MASRSKQADAMSALVSVVSKQETKEVAPEAPVEAPEAQEAPAAQEPTDDQEASESEEAPATLGEWVEHESNEPPADVAINCQPMCRCSIPELVPAGATDLHQTVDEYLGVVRESDDTESLLVGPVFATLSPKELAFIYLMRSIGQGSLDGMDIRDGQPRTVKAGAQLLDFENSDHLRKMIQRKVTYVDMTPGVMGNSPIAGNR